jgi:hypothetical protein
LPTKKKSATTSHSNPFRPNDAKHKSWETAVDIVEEEFERISAIFHECTNLADAADAWLYRKCAEFDVIAKIFVKTATDYGDKQFAFACLDHIETRMLAAADADKYLSDEVKRQLPSKIGGRKDYWRAEVRARVRSKRESESHKIGLSDDGRTYITPERAVRLTSERAKKFAKLMAKEWKNGNEEVEIAYITEVLDCVGIRLRDAIGKKIYRDLICVGKSKGTIRLKFPPPRK